MAFSKDYMDVVGGSKIEPTNVKGNRMAHNDIRKMSSYKSKETPGWKKIEVPDGQHYKEREQSGKDVPMPPVLDLP